MKSLCNTSEWFDFSPKADEWDNDLDPEKVKVPKRKRRYGKAKHALYHKLNLGFPGITEYCNSLYTVKY